MATMTTATVDNRRQTRSLIGSDKVEGTPVYGTNDESIGTVQRVMIDKVSGKVAYAVVSFGGFLGIGEDYYPIPWPQLKYDTDIGGYRVGVTVDTLRGAPKYTPIGTGATASTTAVSTTTTTSRSGIDRALVPTEQSADEAWPRTSGAGFFIGRAESDVQPRAKLIRTTFLVLRLR